MMVIGLLEVVEESVYRVMRGEGLWGTEKKLNEQDIEVVKNKMLKWFGKKVIWGLMEGSVLLRVFYRLIVGLKE